MTKISDDQFYEVLDLVEIGYTIQNAVHKVFGKESKSTKFFYEALTLEQKTELSYIKTANAKYSTGAASIGNSRSPARKAKKDFKHD